MHGYDEWKTDNNESDHLICEHCEAIEPEDNITEVRFIDADGDRGGLFLCIKCVEDQIWV